MSSSEESKLPRLPSQHSQVLPLSCAELPVRLSLSSVTGTQPILTFAPGLALCPQPHPDPASLPFFCFNLLTRLLLT